MENTSNSEIDHLNESHHEKFEIDASRGNQKEYFNSDELLNSQVSEHQSGGSTKAIQKESNVPYSRFTQYQKYGLVAQCAFTGFFSSIAGAIYYPALTIIENKFHILRNKLILVLWFIFFSKVLHLVLWVLWQTHMAEDLL